MPSSVFSHYGGPASHPGVDFVLVEEGAAPCLDQVGVLDGGEQRVFAQLLLTGCAVLHQVRVVRVQFVLGGQHPTLQAQLLRVHFDVSAGQQTRAE